MQGLTVSSVPAAENRDCSDPIDSYRNLQFPVSRTYSQVDCTVLASIVVLKCEISGFERQLFPFRRFVTVEVPDSPFCSSLHSAGFKE